MSVGDAAAPNSDVTDQGLKELARHTRLTELSLNGVSKVTDAGLKELAPLTNLTFLHLGSTNVTDAGLKEVAAMKGLTSLCLPNRVTDEGLKELAALKSLNALMLYGTKVTDAGLKELAPLKNLTELSLQKTQVTDAGMKDLALLGNLNRLDLRETRVTEAGVAELQRALPRTQIESSKSTSSQDNANPPKKSDGPLVLEGHTKGITCVAFMPDGKAICTASDDLTVKVWSLPEGKLLTTLKGFRFEVAHMAMSSANILVTSDLLDVKLWDTKNWKELFTLSDNGLGRPLAFHPNGKTLATATQSGTVKLWGVSLDKTREQTQGTKLSDDYKWVQLHLQRSFHATFFSCNG